MGSVLRVAIVDPKDASRDSLKAALLGLDTAQAMDFGALPRVSDPLDRLIIASARATQSRLLSADEALDGDGVERVWD